MAAPFGLSLALAGLTTAALVPLAVPIAYALAFGRGRWRPWAEAAVALPMALPPTVLGFYLLQALGPHGWLGGLWAAAIAMVPGFGAPAAPEFTGYVEAKYVYVAAPSAGIIDSFPAKEGQLVKKGDVLFVQTTAQLKAAADAAEAQVAEAKANWDNLTTGGRAEELAVGQTELALRRDVAHADAAPVAAEITQSV